MNYPIMRPSINPVKQKPDSQNGFTLIEMMLVIAIFALMMTMTYQSIVAGVQAKSIVQARVAEQEMLRVAHRTLQYAFSSGARIKGTVNRVEIDLGYADSEWLGSIERVELEVNGKGELRAVTDNSVKPTVLLKGLDKLGFGYVSNGHEYAVWDQQRGPDAVVLFWVNSDKQQQWWFTKQ